MSDRSDPSLLVLGGVSAACAVLAPTAAGGVAIVRGHRPSEVGLGAAWGLFAYVGLAGLLIILATISVGDALQ